jgi:hypothetical protein
VTEGRERTDKECVWVSISMHEPLQLNKGQATLPLCNILQMKDYSAFIRLNKGLDRKVRWNNNTYTMTLKRRIEQSQLNRHGHPHTTNKSMSVIS